MDSLRWNSNHILPVSSGVKRMFITQRWSGVIRGIFKDFSFVEQFQVHTNTEVKVQRFSTCSLNLFMHRRPHYQHLCIPRQRGPFVTTDEPAQIYYYQPQSTVHTRAHSWCWAFCGVGRCVITCIHQSSITQTRSTAPNMPCALSIRPPPLH